MNARSPTWRERALSFLFAWLPIKHGKHRLLDRCFPLQSTASPDFVRFPFAGRPLVVDSSDLVGWHMLVLRGFDPAVCEALTTHGRALSELVFWDIGANKGAASYEIARIFPHAKLVLFEPQHELREALLHNLDQLAEGRYELFSNALGERHERKLIHVPVANRGAASLVHQPTGPDVLSVEIQVETAQDMANASQFGWPNLVKIDVEGFELSVIRSLLPALESKRIHALVFECHPERHADFNAILGYAQQYGYEVLAISKTWYNTRYLPCKSLVEGCADYLMTRKH